MEYKIFFKQSDGFPPHGFDLVFKFPKENEPIAISDYGTYVLAVSVNLHDVEEKFAVQYM
jgi:hypothetical protein